MRFMLTVILLLASWTPSRADQPAAANTLTPAEIADGWILLFDGKTTFGWIFTGDVKVEDGKLILGRKDEATAQTTCSFGPAIVRVVYSPLYANNPFKIDFQNSTQGVNLISSLAVTAESRPRNVDKNGNQIGNGKDLVPHAEPLILSTPKGLPVEVKSVKLRPMSMTSIFNGKDLTGWHPYVGADAKSKFSVTPEGTLHIENGKGDLQTDKKWADFLLQIECKTNAKALNSGVFFRCQPDKYQQGYEAQIQNSFMSSPTKEYIIERYDPKTNALLGKDKVKYDSFDYGTGAIYRRIPARFQACKDMEWFTMTILAQGRHMGVWVNGLMVTDWIDNRPINDNARNGCKLEAGNISLQGHDPTTNLDFRNIRITELPKP
jgi:Domain of Unknown Function (DUF1080)